MPPPPVPRGRAWQVSAGCTPSRSPTAGRIRGTGIATLHADDPGNLEHARAAVTATEITGNNTARWTPTVHVHVPPGQAPDVYTGTITHSVA